MSGRRWSLWLVLMKLEVGVSLALAETADRDGCHRDVQG